MSLLEDAANYEEQHWRNRLTGWRRQAARDYLGQVGKIATLIIVAVLLLDGARRDLTHGTATVVAVTGGVTLQTANNKHAPAQSFVGQTYSLGDTLLTDETGTVTLAFPDTTVIQLGPNNQLRQTQSNSYRSGSQDRTFQVGDGPLQSYNANNVYLSLLNSEGGGALGGGNQTLAYFGSNTSASLSRYAVTPSLLVRVERAVWSPLDLVLNLLGVTNRGTLLGTDSQRRADCRRVCAALQKSLPTVSALPKGALIPLENLGLPADLLPVGEKSLFGPYIRLLSRGQNFVAQVRARDSVGTVFEVTAQGIVELKKPQPAKK